ncbi:unnamed protein product [Brassica napus]|uniref:(rape) hypothetical protein n=1 Tax=Brassica napus TaxID=3708 RepID=A0A816KST1_BRANA|nr:unnamed protein product [Brassica napus]
MKLSLGIQDQLSCVCDLHESCLVRDLHESCLVREFNRNVCVSKREGGVTRSARGIKTRFWPRRREKALDLRIPKCQDEVINVICYGNISLLGREPLSLENHRWRAPELSPRFVSDVTVNRDEVTRTRIGTTTFATTNNHGHRSTPPPAANHWGDSSHFTVKPHSGNPNKPQYNGRIIVNPGLQNGLEGWSQYGNDKVNFTEFEGNKFVIVRGRNQLYDSVSQKVCLEKGLLCTFSACNLVTSRPRERSRESRLQEEW